MAGDWQSPGFETPAPTDHREVVDAPGKRPEGVNAEQEPTTMTTVNMTLTGDTILTHNVQLANPLNEYARRMSAISSKRKKTDEDHAAMAEIEFYGSLYLTEDGSVGIPVWNVLRSIQDGAKKNRLGKAVAEGLLPADPFTEVVVLDHDGPSKPDDAWNAKCYDQRSVKVGMSTVTRTRPRFRQWSVSAEFLVDDEVIRFDDLRLAADTAGRLVGLGDYRPRFGRFDIAVEVVV